MTERQGRRVDEQRTKNDNVNEEHKARNLSDLPVVTLLEVRIAAAIKEKFDSNKGFVDGQLAYETDPSSWNTGK